MNGIARCSWIAVPSSDPVNWNAPSPAIETTGTFKFRKVDLVRDGFNPAKIEHALYFDDPEEQRYVAITPELYARIQAGAFKL